MKKLSRFLFSYRLLFSIILLVCLQLWVFAPTWQNDFTLDDFVILQAAYPRNLDQCWHLLLEPVAHRLILHYRPLSFASFVLDQALWGSDPSGYHLTNLLLAIATSLVIFATLWLLLSEGQALAGAILFAIFPGHAEAVIGIYNRSQVLATLFTMLAIYCLLRVLHQQKISRLWLLASAGATFIGCLAKESTLVIFILSALLIWYWRPRPQLRNHVVGAVLLQLLACLCYLLLRYHALGTIAMPGVDAFVESRSPLVIYCNASYIFGRYLLLLVFPLHLSCDYPLLPVVWHWTALFLPILVVTALLALAKGRQKQRLASLGFLWFLVALLPVLHLVPLQIAMAERLLYPAYFGAVLVIVIILAQFKRGFFPLTLVLTVAMALITHARCFDWRDNATLWRQASITYPESFRAQIFFGTQAARQKKWRQALHHYDQAQARRPNHNNQLLIHYNRAQVLLLMKKNDQAIAALRQSLQLAPDYSPAWIMLGDIAMEKHQWSAALRFYRKAGSAGNRWDREYAKLLGKKGQCFLQLGEWEKARRIYGDAIFYDSGNYLFYEYLGYTNLQLARYSNAERCLKQALQMQPQSCHLYFLLALSYHRQKRENEARYYYSKAKKLKPPQSSLPPLK